jgi:hypothetical protein
MKKQLDNIDNPLYVATLNKCCAKNVQFLNAKKEKNDEKTLRKI